MPAFLHLQPDAGQDGVAWFGGGGGEQKRGAGGRAPGLRQDRQQQRDEELEECSHSVIDARIVRMFEMIFAGGVTWVPFTIPHRVARAA